MARKNGARVSVDVERERTIYLCAGPRNGDMRQGCGYDMTALILAVDTDDQLHEVICPVCLTAVTIRRVSVHGG